MSTITFKTIEEQIRQRFGTLSETQMDQQIFDLAPVIGVDPDAEVITDLQFQRACQLIEIIYQQKAMTFEEASKVLENSAMEVSPQNGLHRTIEQQAEQIIEEIPIQVTAAKNSMQQGIQYALAERVAQKLNETDINAKVEELMQQQPKKQEPSFLEMLGLPPVPPAPVSKRLTGS